MRMKPGVFSLAALILSALLAAAFLWLGLRMAVPATTSADVITWVDFSVPANALAKAMDIDIRTYGDDNAPHLDWIKLLSILGTKYGGSWGLYKDADMDAVAARLSEGESPQDILEGYSNYDYFFRIYSAVLGGFLGEYEKEVPDKDNPGQAVLRDRYGLKAFSPIAEGYSYNHYQDFGDSRSYGYRRRHLGHDLCGAIGTPITAVEAGVIEELGWNRYGGWRIGIRSFDKERYYYYAHMRRGHPYAAGLKAGDSVQAGDVIGYMGMTGYSAREDANNMTIPHLHFGIQLIFDESQKEGSDQIWIDVYPLVKLLERNRATVERMEDTKDYRRKYVMYDENFPRPASSSAVF